MAIAKMPFKKLEPLLRKHLRTKEDEKTQKVIDRLRPTKKRGYLTKQDLVEICRWKSARAIRHIQSNRANKIESVTRKVFKARSERKRLELLVGLKGVSIPMASAVLMLTDPKRYGVIDIRVWQVLYGIGSVNTNPRGINFDFKEWYRFLMIIRYFAKKFKVSARNIEKTIFNVHVRYQNGNLYKENKSKR